MHHNINRLKKLINMKKFNVIIEDINRREFVSYDVIPYFVRCYKALKKCEKKPSSFEEFKKFVEDRSRYMFWCRCEYEVILSSWPPSKNGLDDGKKIDVHWQIMMNIDIITDIVMKECNSLKKN